jgi:pimeloyl-ACP methyl ester carboxylesterase
MWTLALLLPLLAAAGRQPFEDRTHLSKIFGEVRHYRLFLPPGYETSGKTYPVIYYFHGHSDRYTLEHYDQGTDTVPKIAAFVAAHEVIVVSVDGYVAKDYTGFYGGAPWDVYEEGGRWDFGEYFRELVAHIDATLRTRTDRRHRATSGLSMGGFMSLWLSARYPDLIGSASAFNPGPEFFAGDPGGRLLWRPKDHVLNHSQSMIRLIRASGDYISQYHEETREAYARTPEVAFEFRQDEYHRHWATSIGETFDFHLRAFANPALDNVPVVFDHDNPYRRFSVWGYAVATDGGLTCLGGVRQGGLRVTTRKWAPDGPPVPARRITITTAPLYAANQAYQILDYSLSSGRTTRGEVKASADGRLSLTVDGAGHQIGIAGPGTGAQPPVLLPVTSRDFLRVMPARDVPLPVRIFNPRGEAMTGVRVALSTEYPTVRLLASSRTIERIEPGGVADLAGAFQIRATAGAGDFAHARIHLRFTYDDWHTAEDRIDLLIAPEVMPAPPAVEVLDGRTVTLDVFRQRGNQGGGASLKRTVTEGQGNGNGVLEPGEEATIWVKLAQGLDPFDKNNWYRAKVYSDSPYVEEIADLAEPKQREWTGAKERTSLIRLSKAAPAGAVVPLVLSNESWSFHFTPDARYGTEKLYQAFQLHRRHLHRLDLRVSGSAGGSQTAASGR